MSDFFKEERRAAFCDRIRSEIADSLCKMEPHRRRKVDALVQMLGGRITTRERQEICEAIAEIIFPEGRDRVSEVIHPNGMRS